MAQRGEIEGNVAVTAIVIAMMANTMIKVIYAYLWGTKKLVKLVGLSAAAMILAGATAVVLV